MLYWRQEKTPHLKVNVDIFKADQTKVMNFSALQHLISQAYLMETKWLKEYFRLRKRPLFETGVTSFVRHKILVTFALFPNTIRWLGKRVTHCKTVSILMYQKCVYNVQTMFVCVCWTKQLTPPTFSPHISVKLKRHDFAKWVKILWRIICKSLLSLTSDDCWGNAIPHVFQTAVLDDVNVNQRLAIGRYSSS